MADDEETAAGGGGGERTLESTPTWAIAAVCLVLILISLFLEQLLHLLAKYFSKKRRKSLLQALDKIKSELMLLGFISLLLTVGEKPITNICIPKSLGERFLPCDNSDSIDEVHEESKCEEQGKISLLSQKGVQQLHYLIFVLASFHCISSALTFSLGMIKMSKWERWEAETKTLEYQFHTDPRRFQLIHQTSFGKRHLRFWSEHRFLRWPACLLRQFFDSVSKVDYFTLRHGFITTHFSEGSHFDFQRYIERALEKDFGVVVGISFWIWLFSITFIFLNAHEFHNSIWLPFIPLAMLLVVGTKLQSIITKMCLDSYNKSHVVQGTLLVKPSDNFFWFGKPKLLLHMIHLILFQNSFQLSFFAWTWYKFGLRSCFHKKTEDIIIRIVIGILVQFLCGYMTLPLYALVTQMGTSMNKAVFTKGVSEGLKKWRAAARRRAAASKAKSKSSSPDESLESSIDVSTSYSSVNIDPRFLDHQEHASMDTTERSFHGFGIAFRDD